MVRNYLFSYCIIFFYKNNFLMYNINIEKRVSLLFVMEYPAKIRRNIMKCKISGRILAVVLACGLGLLAGCSSAQGPGSSAPASEPEPAPPSVDFSPMQTNGVEVLREDLEDDGFSSSSGYYRVIFREDQIAFNLCYTDFATRQEIYLCNQPNCTHDNESCTSWFPLDNAITYPVPVSDKLVLIHGAVPGYAEVMKEDGVAQVILMNPDGSEQKTIARFSSTDRIASVPPGGLARDNENVYFVLESDIDGTRTLYAANVNTETVEPLYVMPEPGEKIVGGVGDELVLSYSPETYDLSVEASDMTSYVVRFNPDTQTVTPLFSHPYLDANICADGKYFRLAADGTIYVHDLETGEVLSEKTTGLAAAEYNEDCFKMEGYFDGKMLVSTQYVPDENSYPVVEYFGIDPTSGEVQEITHTYTSYYGDELPSAIKGQTETEYLIVTGDTKGMMMLAVYDEQLQEYIEMLQITETYSMIPKEDFWANRSTAVPIADSKT